MLDPRLVQVISRAFGVKPHDITPDSSSESIAAWDSVGHLNLILDIEDAFGIRFSTEEIPALTSAGSLQKALDSRPRG